MPHKPDWIGSTTAGKVLDVNPRTLLEWAEKGLMPNVRTRVLPTGRTQFNRVDLQGYADMLNGEGKEEHDYS
jgi:predicted site-specific integrase-resolvase